MYNYELYMFFWCNFVITDEVKKEKKLAKKSGAAAGINEEEKNENIKGTEERNDSNG